MFDPTIGQFVNDDPIEFDAGDPNLRRFVGENPTNATDPSGLRKVTEADFDEAEAELRKARPALSEGEIKARLAVLRAATTGAVSGTGQVRNDEYWIERGDAWIVRDDKDFSDALLEMWKYQGGKVFCETYSQIVIAKGYVDRLYDTQGNRTLVRRSKYCSESLEVKPLGCWVPDGNEIPRDGEDSWHGRWLQVFNGVLKQLQIRALIAATITVCSK